MRTFTFTGSSEERNVTRDTSVVLKDTFIIGVLALTVDYMAGLLNGFSDGPVCRFLHELPIDGVYVFGLVVALQGLLVLGIFVGNERFVRTCLYKIRDWSVYFAIVLAFFSGFFMSKFFWGIVESFFVSGQHAFDPNTFVKILVCFFLSYLTLGCRKIALWGLRST